jgi:hypothetical protein
MPIKAARITVTDAATAIAGDEDETLEPATLIVRNRGSESVDLGGSNVTSGAGFELKTTEREEITLARGEQLFGIAATGKSVRIDVLKVGD